VYLCDGTVRGRVYIVDAEDYERTWGVGRNHTTITLSVIAAVEESPERLSPEFADVLYQAGESGMGYCVFVVEFRDGTDQAYITGNTVDFLPYPPGKSPSDIAGVSPHRGRDRPQLRSLSYEWCPVNGLREAIE
jgi:hypothetical protein